MTLGLVGVDYQSGISGRDKFSWIGIGVGLIVAAEI